MSYLNEVKVEPCAKCGGTDFRVYEERCLGAIRGVEREPYIETEYVVYAECQKCNEVQTLDEP